MGIVCSSKVEGCQDGSEQLLHEMPYSILHKVLNVPYALSSYMQFVTSGTTHRSDIFAFAICIAELVHMS